MICTLHQILTGDQVKQNEIDGACVAYGEEDSSIPSFCGEKQRERDHLAETGVGGRIILKQILKKSVWEGVN